MSVPQSLVAALPAPMQAFANSFIDEELATKILPGIRYIEDADSFGEASDTRKRRREDEEPQAAAKRLKEMHFRDSLPTPWKVSSFDKGPLEIMREERLVREEKYKISIDTPISVNRIKDLMSSKGWDLKYTINADNFIVKVIVEVASEFGYSFLQILDDLEKILVI
ncbi:hypothetical protein BKA56DRAFT_239657 [Ilyonectria sp. MPI-CAGE-AT-0026]|nr:hypothetical protein BKA56DRAFT_239657 [Ilyonectria sp. MPI-CAGE-AT-0026]